MEKKEEIFDSMLDVFARFSYPSENVFYLQHCWDKAHEVFDLGCGNAAYTALLSGSYSDKHFTCAELNPVLSDIACNRTDSSRINIITGSYEDMPADYRFDFLLARLVITHIDDIASFMKWADSHSAPDAAILIIDADIGNFNFGSGLPLFTRLFEAKSKENNFGTLSGLNDKILHIFKNSAFLFNSTKFVKLQAYTKETKELLHTYMSCIAQLGTGTPLSPSLKNELSAWLENPESKLELALFGTLLIKKSHPDCLKCIHLSDSKNVESKPIDCLHDFDDSMREVFEICRQKISLYPESIRQTGLDFLEGYDIFSKSSHKNYISYLLPFWLRPHFSIEYADLLTLSASNTFLMLYAILQDDVMDTAPGEYNADILPLGNMFFLNFMQCYRSLFSSGSIIWGYLDKYFAQWADSVTSEHKQHWNKMKEFTPSDITMLAGKAAPLKVSCAAACLICSKESDLEPLCSIVDYIFILLQLLDDWADWQEDLSAGNCTCLLSEVMKYSRIDNLSLLTVSHVTDAVFFGNILDKVFSAVYDLSPSTKNKSSLYLPYLDAFIEILLKNCKDIISAVEAEKTARLKGGFDYWLTRQSS